MSRDAAEPCTCTEPVCVRSRFVAPSGCQCVATGPYSGTINMLRAMADRLEIAHSTRQFADARYGLQLIVASLSKLAGRDVIDLDEQREKRRRHREYLERRSDLTADLAELFNVAVALQLYDTDAFERLLETAREIAAGHEIAGSQALRAHARCSRDLFRGFRDELNELAAAQVSSVDDVRQADAALARDIEADGPFISAVRAYEARRDIELE